MKTHPSSMAASVEEHLVGGRKPAHGAVALAAFGVVVAILTASEVAASTVAGTIGDITVTLASVVTGDAGSDQMGILLSSGPTPGCEIAKKVLSKGNSTYLSVLVPNKIGTFGIKHGSRSVRDTSAGDLYYPLNGRKEKHQATSGWVRIEKIATSPNGTISSLEGKLHVEFEGGSIEGSFTAPYCGPIGL